MKAMIFAAGLGTRFKPWTDHHPKALAAVNGSSLLERNLRYLQRFGITEVVVNVHHFADQISEALERSGGWGSTVRVSDERDEVLETGGGLLKAAPWLISEEPVVVMNADILTDLPLDQMMDRHMKQRPLATLAVTDRASSRNFLFDEPLRLCGWENRSTGDRRIVRDEPRLRAMGYSCVALLEPAFLQAIPQRGKFSLTETYLSLAATHTLLGFDHSGGRFIDVGKPESVAEAERMFE